VTTASGDLTVAQNVTTTDTSAAAITLNADSGAAAGTSAGGNILINGSPTINVGAGGIATLFSGSIAGSTGLTSLIGSGSGRFRYNSDESATNYTAALTGGAYAVYREQPTATVTANDQNLTYGTVPTGTSTVTGLQNGDTTAQAVTTAATVTADGSTSTSGNHVAGVHTLTPSGAVGGLGYAFNYATGTLTVNQKALNVTYTGVDKVYDGTTSAIVTTSDDHETGDVINITRTAAFAPDKNVGVGKIIDVTSVGVSGADAANYSVAATGSATANISARTLNVIYSGQNKVYDGTTLAVVNVVSDDRVAGDSFTINRTANFTPDKNVGIGKTVDVTGVSLSGTDAGNYAVSSTGTTAANITTRTLNVEAVEKVKLLWTR
jgi:ribosomal protein L27